MKYDNGEDKDAKASLMAKIIDKEGAEFGATIGRKSKVMQEIHQLNPEQTSSLMTSTRTPEYVWRQSRTAFKDNLGFSPISSRPTTAFLLSRYALALLF